ncbi:hypothetical protein BMBphi_gp012 [Bacillus phage vB_BthS_BMBphi]|nr:hypothetical protein BMBphi_gp012 [Bacillus phage vB_BthS_BMBphi]
MKYNIGDELVVAKDYMTFREGDTFTYYGDSSREGCAKGYQNGIKLMKFIPYKFLETKKEFEKKFLEGKVVKFKSIVDEGKLLIGYVVKVNEYAKVYYSERKFSIRVSTDRIMEVYDLVVHEPKKKIPTKPYKQLVSYEYGFSRNIRWGVFSHMNGDKVYAHWSNRPRCQFSDYTEYMPLDRIIDIVDIIIHEPKEDKLTVAQEASNFGYQAVQGIIEAHKDKENPSEVPPFKKKTLFSKEDINDSYAKGYHEATMNYLNTFTFSDFDTSVKRTWKDQDFKDAVSNASLGLTGEAGEVADLIKKAIYHGRNFDERCPTAKAIKVSDVKDELSDVLFYVSAMAQEFGFTLEDVARHNKEKLEKRYEKGFTVEESAKKKDKHSIEYKVPTTVRGGF